MDGHGQPPVARALRLEASSLNGKEVGSTQAVLAADGKTVTRVVKGVDAKGKAYQNTEVYERQ